MILSNLDFSLVMLLNGLALHLAWFMRGPPFRSEGTRGSATPAQWPAFRAVSPWKSAM